MGRARQDYGLSQQKRPRFDPRQDSRLRQDQRHRRRLPQLLPERPRRPMSYRCTSYSRRIRHPRNRYPCFIACWQERSIADRASRTRIDASSSDNHERKARAFLGDSHPAFGRALEFECVFVDVAFVGLPATPPARARGILEVGASPPGSIPLAHDAWARAFQGSSLQH